MGFGSRIKEKIIYKIVKSKNINKKEKIMKHNKSMLRCQAELKMECAWLISWLS